MNISDLVRLIDDRIRYALMKFRMGQSDASYSLPPQHLPVTVTDTTSIDLTISASQALSADAKFGTTSGTVAEGNHTHAGGSISGSGTNGKMTKWTGSSSIGDATNTDTEVASAVSLKHTQGTDTALGTLSTKNPPVDADLIVMRDSANSFSLFTSTWTQVKAFLKTYFDTIYSALGHTHSYLTSALTSAHILVGNASNVATDVAMSGDATISNAGVVSVNKTRLIVRNETGTTIATTKAVYMVGFNNYPLVALASNTDETKHNFLGITVGAITDQTNGYIATSGQCDAETNSWNVGDELYLSTSGALVNVEPTSGGVMHVGIVTVKQNYPDGKILIYMHPEGSIMAVGANQDAVIRVGDSAGSNKLSIQRYDDTEVAFINSAGHVKVEGVISTGATGTGKFVFDGSPTLVTPIVASLTNMQHAHIDAASGGEIAFGSQFNYLANSGMETWSLGASVPPDKWVVSASGAVARESSTIDSFSVFSAKLTIVSTTSAYMAQSVLDYLDFKGRTLTLSARIKCSTASSAYVSIVDGTTSYDSSFHSGGGGWETLTITRTISFTSSTNIVVVIHNTNSGAAIYIDNVALCIGSSASLVPSPQRTRVLDSDINLFDTTTADASTANHGLILKAVAPGAGLRNVVAIDSGETTYKNTALFDNTNPADVGTASPGTSLIAARRDHVHTGTTTAPFPKGYLFGLGIANNGSDSTNDIDITAGQCRDSANAYDMVLASALTKRLDAAWSVGTNQGGLDTGSIANTTYHIFLIKRSDTGVVDALFSTSATAPTMPTNYDSKRRIASIMRESGTLIPIVQTGDNFSRTPVVNINAGSSLGTSAVTQAISVPTGIRLQAILGHGMNVTSNTGARLSDLSTPDLDPINTPNMTNFTSAGSAVTTAIAYVYTNTSAQIRYRLSASGATIYFYLWTNGWIDTRGKDA